MSQEKIAIFISLKTFTSNAKLSTINRVWPHWAIFFNPNLTELPKTNAKKWNNSIKYQKIQKHVYKSLFNCFKLKFVQVMPSRHNSGLFYNIEHGQTLRSVFYRYRKMRKWCQMKSHAPVNNNKNKINK